MTDVAMQHTENGGEIEFVAGQAVMDDGLFNAVYLSLFGGNDEDSGLESGERLEWWANKVEPDPARRYRSETQFLLQSLPLVPANLLRIEDAAGRDLAWMVDLVASSVDVTAIMPALNAVKLEVSIVVDDEKFDFAFTRFARERAT